MSTPEPSLFDGPGPTRRSAPDTSHHAAIVNQRGRVRQIERVLGFIVERTPTGGCTCEEMALALDLRLQSASARCTDLRGAGLIRDSGNRRRTTSGAYAAVLLAVTLAPCSRQGRTEGEALP